MESSNTPNISNPQTTCSVTLPVERTTTETANESRDNFLIERNSSSAHRYRSSSDIPPIPDIPSPLLRPPTAGRNVAVSESSENLPFSAASGTTNGYGT